MKQKIKISLMFLLTLVFINCSKDDQFGNHTHGTHSHNDEVSFKQFKNETGINKFDYLKKANISKSIDFQVRTIESEFITDTIGIKKYTNPIDNKTTYSFKIYPLSEDLNSKEYYNLVYEKVGTEWNEIIFFNTEKDNPTDGRTLESSEMVFNSRSPHTGYIEVIHQHIRCNGSCGSGPCDGFACTTGECIATTIEYLYIGQDSGLGSDSGSGGFGNGTSGGGSSPLDGLFIPNPYDGIDMNDPNNASLLLMFEINTYFNTLSPELKEIAKYYVNFAFAFEYFSLNGLSNVTKQHYLTALINYKNFIEATTNTQVNTDAQAELEYWAFQTFLNNNENGLNNSKINKIKDFLNNPNVDFATKEKIINELATKNNQEAIDFVKELIDTSIDLDINVAEIWFNDYELFRNQMSDSERTIFDNMIRNRQMWYMGAAYKAKTMAEELYPDSLHNGKGDAYRHALWNGLSSLLIGNDLTNQLTTAHENKPPSYVYNNMEIAMDLYNNDKGRVVASFSNLTNIFQNILNYTQLGFLRYLNNLDTNGFATYNSQLIPTNQ